MAKEYLQDFESVLSEQRVTKNNGLSNEEANQRLQNNGKNVLAQAKKKSIFVRFLGELADPMIIILLVAAAISGITAYIEKESFADVFIILAVVIINAILGVYQESKAEKAIEALQKISASTSKVIRNGEMQIVKSEDIVVGDIIVIEAGDSIPADARIIECASLKIEESALTGESVPVTKKSEKLLLIDKKDIPLGDRKNMLYMGSNVAYGRGVAVVVATGMQTEMGKIAHALTEAKQGDTPLQKKLNHLSKILTYMVLGICVFIFAFNLLMADKINGEVIVNTLLVAVSLAVAAIPEGLAAVVTVVLSIGVTNMAKHNAVIRKLTAVETLGCAEIICSDKTGTLTQNKMTVVDHKSYDEKLLATAMCLCSDAKLNSENQAVGEPTECALVNYAFSLGLDKKILSEKQKRVSEAPFDSMRKMMSTLHEYNGKIIQYTKGAPDEIIKRCSKALVDGKEIPLTEKIKEDILHSNKDMADRALRVLCASYKKYDKLPKFNSSEEIENDLCYIGLTGMIDPVREEVRGAIVECKTAGIRPIMITGDHKDTAVAIARQLGIITSISQAITGAELDEISDEDFEKKIIEYSVYARVQPEHKVRIVNTWKKLGKVTAMTGDGVNDAPSIKSADIGVGMGITGTDVTKNVADMVLTDDNFATIVSATKEGRRIYDNIRKAIQFLLASNLAEVLAIFITTLMGFTILKPVHLLWINLITDCFPALSLGMEEGEKDLMHRPPRKSDENLFSNGMGFDIVFDGLIIALITISAYFVGHFMEAGVWEITESPDGMTMAFIALSMAEIFHAFNARSSKNSIFTLKKQNIWLWGACIASLLCTLAVIYIPFLSNAFGFESISFIEYLVAMALAFCIIPIAELQKLIERLIAKKKAKKNN